MTFPSSHPKTNTDISIMMLLSGTPSITVPYSTVDHKTRAKAYQAIFPQEFFAKPRSTMRSLPLLVAFMRWTAAFTTIQRPASFKPLSTTQVDLVSRRDALLGIVAASALAPEAARAFSQQLDDYAYEPQQQATDGKWDLNSVFVGDYKYFPGMFPTSAGKIASHGPYEKVSDIYKIPGLTDQDIKNFKKYEKYFTVHPPGRSFYERINNRVST